jgi:DNA-binding MarR family transcriptional regulator
MLSTIYLTEYNKDMKAQALQDNLYWLFMQASFRAKKGFIKLADEHGLSVVQLYALVSLEPGVPMPMKDIAGLLNCDPSNVTGICDRLFLQQYIEREELAADRRVKMITLTLKGVRLRGKLVQGILSYHSEQLDRLSDDDQHALKGLLFQILSPKTAEANH